MAGLTTQVSMGGGEIATYLFARSDLNKFKIGASKVLNACVRPQGGVYNRSGTRYVDKAYHELGVPVTTKFHSFDAEDNDTLVLMFSKNKIWFVRTGALIRFLAPQAAAGRAGAISETHGVAGDIMEIVGPWGADDVLKIKKTQSEDVMTITCEGFDPYELRRYGYYDWTLIKVDTSPKIAPPTDVVATPTVDLTVPAGVATPTIYNQTYYYVVSAIDVNGNESLASANDDALNDLSWRGNYNTITWTGVTGAVKYNVYKAINSVYGFVGATTELTFADRNLAPNLADTPKTGRNPFADADKKPEVVEFHQSRRWFGNYEAAHQSFDASGSDSYSDFNVSSPAKDDDAISGTIAARRRQAIYWFIPLQELVVFTQSGEWKFVGGNNDGDTITPSSIDARPQSTYGCRKYIQPLIIGSRILFVQALGGVIYDMGYEITENKYVADELSALSIHLFEGRVVLQWSYDIKNHLLWMVMSDGKVVCITYHREHELWAASQHDTQGKFVDVLCIPEGDVIGTYWLVDRKTSLGTERFVERSTDRFQRDDMDGFFVDCGLTYDSPCAITEIEVINSATVRVHTAIAHTVPNGGEVILSDVGGFKIIEDAANGSTNKFDRGLNKKFIVSNVSSDTFDIPFDTSDARMQPWDEDVTYAAARKMVTIISGFEHLAGKDIAVVGDGEVYEGLSVDATGKFVLPRGAGRVHAGLGYISKFYSLDLDAGVETTQGIIRKVNRVHIRVNRTRGIKIGSSPTALTEAYPRQHEDFDSPPLYESSYVSVTCSADPLVTGLVFVEQQYPLPMELLSLTPDIEFGNQN